MIEQIEDIAGDILPDEVIVEVGEVSTDDPDVVVDPDVVADEQAVEKADDVGECEPEIAICDGFIGEDSKVLVDPAVVDDGGEILLDKLVVIEDADGGEEPAVLAIEPVNDDDMIMTTTGEDDTTVVDPPEEVVDDSSGTVTDDVKRTDDEATVDLWLGDDALQILPPGDGDGTGIYYTYDPNETSDAPMIYHTMFAEMGGNVPDEPGTPSPISDTPAGEVTVPDVISPLSCAYPLY